MYSVICRLCHDSSFDVISGLSNCALQTMKRDFIRKVDVNFQFVASSNYRMVISSRTCKVRKNAAWLDILGSLRLFFHCTMTDFYCIPFQIDCLFLVSHSWNWGGAMRLRGYPHFHCIPFRISRNPSLTFPTNSADGAFGLISLHASHSMHRDSRSAHFPVPNDPNFARTKKYR
jgi:hypothetical protein